jgi:hypothetical protein
MRKRRPRRRSVPTKTRSDLCIRPCQDEDDYRCAPTDFFEDAWNHEGAIARRVCRDDDKGDLPRQADSHESIEESWMRDGRWIVAPNEIKHKVKRCENQQAPDARNPKYNLRKSHGFLEELK